MTLWNMTETDFDSDRDIADRVLSKLYSLSKGTKPTDFAFFRWLQEMTDSGFHPQFDSVSFTIVLPVKANEFEFVVRASVSGKRIGEPVEVYEVALQYTFRESPDLPNCW